jgi:hypothetical protein
LARCEAFPAIVRKEVFGRHRVYALLYGKGLGARPAEHDVRRFLHNGPRQPDGVFYNGDAAYGAGIELRTVHDGSVQFVFPGIGKHSAPARIEQRRIFQKHNGSLYRIHCSATLFEYFFADVQGGIQRGQVGSFHFRRHVFAAESTRAAVNDERVGRLIALLHSS